MYGSIDIIWSIENVSSSLLLAKFNEKPLAFCLILDVTTVMLSILISRLIESVVVESATDLLASAVACAFVVRDSNAVNIKMMFLIYLNFFGLTVLCTQASTVL